MLSVGSVFTGIGMLDYGLHLAGLTDHRWVCERDEWRREHILAQRFPRAVRYDDVRAVGHGCEPVELFAGGFPCKGVSTAGPRNGFEHDETVLWREMRRAIGELGPRYVLVENVANLLSLHGGALWAEVLGDLASLGFDVVWDCLPAAAVGAPHLRDRVFAVASHPDGAREWRDRDERREADRRADAARGTSVSAANPHGEGVRQQPEPQSERRGSAESRRNLEVAEDPNRGAAQPAWRERRGEPQGAGRPLAVEWGKYGLAIERWERALGRPAGEPLLQGVVDGGARRLVRSRLSALGDGVCVQVGYLAGRYIVDLEERREELAA